MRIKCGPLALLIVLVCAFNALAQTQPRNAQLHDGPTTPLPSVVAPARTETSTEIKDVAKDTSVATAPSATSVVTAADGNTPAEVTKANGDPAETAATATTTKLGHTAITATPASTRTSPQATDPDKWHFEFAPYFWLASLHGTAGVGNRTTQVDESFGDIFDNLKFALLGAFGARKGRFVMQADAEYISIEDDGATPGPFFSDATAQFKMFIFSPQAGYRLYDDPDKGASVDVLGGIRVWHLNTELDFGAGILPAVHLEGSRTWVDAIVGLRGKAAIAEKVFVIGNFNLGGGGSKFTWQLFGGLGYNIKPNIALVGGYRVLDVDYNKDNFIYDINQRGPIMGIAFRF